MGYVVFCSGPSATHTGTGILEPVTITYSFTYLTPFRLSVAEPCGSALTVATPAANATMETSAKLIICFIFMLYIRSRSASFTIARSRDFGTPPEMYRSLPLQSECFQRSDGLLRQSGAGVQRLDGRVLIARYSSPARLRDRLVSAAYRDTRIVGQDLSWSVSTGNFAYLIIVITPDGVRCFW
jgi:hypothetical protein